MGESGEESSEVCYGGCEGRDSMYVKLISTDKHEFIIKRQYTTISEYLAEKLTVKGKAKRVSNEVVLEEIQSIVLQKVCQFLIMQAKYANLPEIPDLDILPEIAVPVLQAAHILDC